MTIYNVTWSLNAKGTYRVDTDSEGKAEMASSYFSDIPLFLTASDFNWEAKAK